MVEAGTPIPALRLAQSASRIPWNRNVYMGWRHGCVTSAVWSSRETGTYFGMCRFGLARILSFVIWDYEASRAE